jgi:pyruvate dehydrogenase E2 component (dihydrolipoyllysine-residue acetyltransferase)
MPALGMNQDTGKLVAWHKREGEAVRKGEPLMEIETDKATVEVEAPAAGTLAGVTAAVGDDVPVGRPVAVILLAGESVGSVTEAPAPPPAGRPPASPKARREAAERGLDLAAVPGSGPGGAVKAIDLPAAAAARTPAPAPPHAPSGIWATMARKTAESWAVPHFYLERECDAGRLQSWRAHVARSDPGVTFTDLLVRLAAAALPHHPLVNGRWDAQAQRTVAAAEVNIGVAAAVENGLVVPVIAGADRLTLAEIAARRVDLLERARGGRLRPEDLQGASFTISNLGMYAVDAFSAIVNAPQAAILAVGRIADRAVAAGGRAEVRPTIRLTLSCDHRAVDGARAAAFLTELGDLVEEPAALL